MLGVQRGEINVSLTLKTPKCHSKKIVHNQVIIVQFLMMQSNSRVMDKGFRIQEYDTLESVF